MGIIYFIKCLETGEVYIGSTKQKLQYRMTSHKCPTNCCVSKQIIERGNYFYDTLEVVEDDKDILIRENYYIKTMKNCINKQKAYQSREDRKEQKKKWREDNKEEIKDYNKKYSIEYREKNKDNLKEYIKKYTQFKNTWGGDPRSNNNLLKIDINLFHDR